MTIKGKIIQGYAIVLGIASAGTLCGAIVGNIYQQRVFSQYEEVSEQHKQLSHLQRDILYNRPAKQLAPYVSNPTVFNRESKQLLHRIEEIQEDLKLARELRDSSTLPELKPLLEHYAIDLDNFYQKSVLIFGKIEEIINPPSQENTATAQNLVVELVKSPEFVAFLEFPDLLWPFDELLETQQHDLKLKLKEAQKLRNLIVALSFVLSINIAAIVISHTTSSISSPIEKLTSFAREILQTSDFSSQISLRSNDEIELLANSINELVQKVHGLLQELQDKTQNLEQALSTVNQQQLYLVTQKMASLRQLVAGIAHEINNPTTFVAGNIEHLEEYCYTLLELVQLYEKHYPHAVSEIVEYCQDNELEFIHEDLPKTIDSMKSGTNRIRDIVLSLRSFSRMGESDRKPVDIHECLDSTLIILQHRLKKQSDRPPIKVTINYADLPKIECHPAQLNQVFMNLFVNAIDALEERYEKEKQNRADGPLTIQITTLAIDSHWMKIAIADNAGGIPQDILDQIFNPFFTTKAIGKGTGMGLAISHQIIHETHRGSLTCNSTPGKGTEFVILIPIRHVPMKN